MINLRSIEWNELNYSDNTELSTIISKIDDYVETCSPSLYPGGILPREIRKSLNDNVTFLFNTCTKVSLPLWFECELRMRTCKMSELGNGIGGNTGSAFRLSESVILRLLRVHCKTGMKLVEYGDIEKAQKYLSIAERKYTNKFLVNTKIGCDILFSLYTYSMQALLQHTQFTESTLLDAEVSTTDNKAFQNSNCLESKEVSKDKTTILSHIENIREKAFSYGQEMLRIAQMIDPDISPIQREREREEAKARGEGEVKEYPIGSLLGDYITALSWIEREGVLLVQAKNYKEAQRWLELTLRLLTASPYSATLNPNTASPSPIPELPQVSAFKRQVGKIHRLLGICVLEQGLLDDAVTHISTAYSTDRGGDSLYLRARVMCLLLARELNTLASDSHVSGSSSESSGSSESDLAYVESERYWEKSLVTLRTLHGHLKGLSRDTTQYIMHSNVQVESVLSLLFFINTTVKKTADYIASKHTYLYTNDGLNNTEHPILNEIGHLIEEVKKECSMKHFFQLARTRWTSSINKLNACEVLCGCENNDVETVKVAILNGYMEGGEREVNVHYVASGNRNTTISIELDPHSNPRSGDDSTLSKSDLGNNGSSGIEETSNITGTSSLTLHALDSRLDGGEGDLFNCSAELIAMLWSKINTYYDECISLHDSCVAYCDASHCDVSLINNSVTQSVVEPYDGTSHRNDISGNVNSKKRPRDSEEGSGRETMINDESEGEMVMGDITAVERDSSSSITNININNLSVASPYIPLPPQSLLEEYSNSTLRLFDWCISLVLVSSDVETRVTALTTLIYVFMKRAKLYFKLHLSSGVEVAGEKMREKNHLNGYRSANMFALVFIMMAFAVGGGIAKCEACSKLTDKNLTYDSSINIENDSIKTCICEKILFFKQTAHVFCYSPQHQHINHPHHNTLNLDKYNDNPLQQHFSWFGDVRSLLSPSFFNTIEANYPIWFNSLTQTLTNPLHQAGSVFKRIPTDDELNLKSVLDLQSNPLTDLYYLFLKTCLHLANQKRESDYSSYSSIFSAGLRQFVSGTTTPQLVTLTHLAQQTNNTVLIDIVDLICERIEQIDYEMCDDKDTIVNDENTDATHSRDHVNDSGSGGGSGGKDMSEIDLDEDMFGVHDPLDSLVVNTEGVYNTNPSPIEDHVHNQVHNNEEKYERNLQPSIEKDIKTAIIQYKTTNLKYQMSSCFNNERQNGGFATLQSHFTPIRLLHIIRVLSRAQTSRLLDSVKRTAGDFNRHKDSGLNTGVGVNGVEVEKTGQDDLHSESLPLPHSNSNSNSNSSFLDERSVSGEQRSVDIMTGHVDLEKDIKRCALLALQSVGVLSSLIHPTSSVFSESVLHMDEVLDLAKDLALIWQNVGVVTLPMIPSLSSCANSIALVVTVSAMICTFILPLLSHSHLEGQHNSTPSNTDNQYYPTESSEFNCVSISTDSTNNPIHASHSSVKSPSLTNQTNPNFSLVLECWLKTSMLLIGIVKYIAVPSYSNLTHTQTTQSSTQCLTPLEIKLKVDREIETWVNTAVKMKNMYNSITAVSLEPFIPSDSSCEMQSSENSEASDKNTLVVYSTDSHYLYSLFLQLLTQPSLNQTSNPISTSTLSNEQCVDNTTYRSAMELTVSSWVMYGVAVGTNALNNPTIHSDSNLNTGTGSGTSVSLSHLSSSSSPSPSPPSISLIELQTHGVILIVHFYRTLFKIEKQLNHNSQSTQSQDKQPISITPQLNAVFRNIIDGNISSEALSSLSLSLLTSLLSDCMELGLVSLGEKILSNICERMVFLVCEQVEEIEENHLVFSQTWANIVSNTTTQHTECLQVLFPSLTKLTSESEVILGRLQQTLFVLVKVLAQAASLGATLSISSKIKDKINILVESYNQQLVLNKEHKQKTNVRLFSSKDIEELQKDKSHILERSVSVPDLIIIINGLVVGLKAWSKTTNILIQVGLWCDYQRQASYISQVNQMETSKTNPQHSIASESSDNNMSMTDTNENANSNISIHEELSATHSLCRCSNLLNSLKSIKSPSLHADTLVSLVWNVAVIWTQSPIRVRLHNAKLLALTTLSLNEALLEMQTKENHLVKPVYKLRRDLNNVSGKDAVNGEKESKLKYEDLMTITQYVQLDNIYYRMKNMVEQRF